MHHFLSDPFELSLHALAQGSKFVRQQSHPGFEAKQPGLISIEHLNHICKELDCCNLVENKGSRVPPQNTLQTSLENLDHVVEAPGRPWVDLSDLALESSDFFQKKAERGGGDLCVIARTGFSMAWGIV